MGSTRALTDEGGDASDTYVYDAWGNEVAISGSTVNPFRWVGNVGYYHDSDLGTLYIRARVYEPVTSRWMSIDPIGFNGRDLNLYRYVGNAPTGAVDPRGEIQRNIVAAPQTTATGFEARYNFTLDNDYDVDITVIQKIHIDSREWKCELPNGRRRVIRPVAIRYYEVVGQVAPRTRDVLREGALAVDVWEGVIRDRWLLRLFDAEIKMEGQVRAFRTADVQGEIAGWEPNLQFRGEEFSGDKPKLTWTSGAFPARDRFLKWATNVQEREFLPPEGEPPVVNQNEPVFNRIHAEWDPRQATPAWEFVEDPGQHPVGERGEFVN